jgi:hypothetical protein
MVTHGLRPGGGGGAHGEKAFLTLAVRGVPLVVLQAGDMSKAFGRGLLEIGMVPLPPGIDFETYEGPSTLMIYEVRYTRSPAQRCKGLANRTDGISRGRSLTRPFRDARRFPSTGL